MCRPKRVVRGQVRLWWQQGRRGFPLDAYEDSAYPNCLLDSHCCMDQGFRVRPGLSNLLNSQLFSRSDVGFMPTLVFVSSEFEKASGCSVLSHWQGPATFCAKVFLKIEANAS